MTDALLERLLAEAPRLPFVSLLHWLERLLIVEIGTSESEPRVRLRHDPSLVFHAGDVKRAELVAGSEYAVEVTTSFAGLTGAVSPLPPVLLEVLAPSGAGEAIDHPLLALVQERLLALLYRGLMKFDLSRLGAAAPARQWVL